MGRVVIAVFKPKPGKEDQLLEVINDRLPLLRRLDMATDRANITMRSKNGTILDVSEWVDDDAIDRAHEHPEVHELWARFDECCTYETLQSLDEVGGMFPTFDAI